ncbi:MAG: hypothetical protein KAW41_01050 [Candidatus Diapherotrites archaeon]|nr:hypothetical protein [Candidatus Diapherotrites archaeon]
MNSIDSNVVIAVANPFDYSHKTSVKTVKNLDELLVLLNVFTESKATIQRKYNKSLAKSVTEIRKITAERNSLLFGKLVVQALEKLKKNNPNLEGFIDLVYSEFRTCENQKDISAAMSRLNVFGVALIKSLEDVLRKERPDIEFYEPTEEFNKMHLKVYDLIAGSYFQDRNDKLIYTDCVALAQIENDKLTFHTFDEEFHKTAKSTNASLPQKYSKLVDFNKLKPN